MNNRRIPENDTRIPGSWKYSFIFLTDIMDQFFVTSTTCQKIMHLFSCPKQITQMVLCYQKIIKMLINQKFTFPKMLYYYQYSTYTYQNKYIIECLQILYNPITLLLICYVQILLMHLYNHFCYNCAYPKVKSIPILFYLNKQKRQIYRNG